MVSWRSSACSSRRSGAPMSTGGGAPATSALEIPADRAGGTGRLHRAKPRLRHRPGRRRGRPRRRPGSGHRRPDRPPTRPRAVDQIRRPPTRPGRWTRRLSDQAPPEAGTDAARFAHGPGRLLADERPRGVAGGDRQRGGARPSGPCSRISTKTRPGCRWASSNRRWRWRPPAAPPGCGSMGNHGDRRSFPLHPGRLDPADRAAPYVVPIHHLPPGGGHGLRGFRAAGPPGQAASVCSLQRPVHRRGRRRAHSLADRHLGARGGHLRRPDLDALSGCRGGGHPRSSADRPGPHRQAALHRHQQERQAGGPNPSWDCSTRSCCIPWRSAPTRSRRCATASAPSAEATRQGRRY